MCFCFAASCIVFGLLPVLINGLEVNDHNGNFRGRGNHLHNSGSVTGSSLHFGAIIMLVSDWKIIRPHRKCHFNASMDALARKWNPHNKYPVILMDTKPWIRDDMRDIRRTWTNLDFKFINVEHVFASQPDSYIGKMEDAKKPLSTVNYKRMCHFFFKGFTEIPLLMEYVYLLRLDDDTCLLDHINYDLFHYLHHKRAAYAYSHIWHDYEKVTKGLYKFVDNYAASQQLQWQNPALHNATMSAKSFPARVPSFNTNFEVINTVRYRDPAILHFVDAVSSSGFVFHRRWGDAPLRFALAMLYWTESELVRLEGFELDHSSWETMPMSEYPDSGNPDLSNVVL